MDQQRLQNAAEGFTQDQQGNKYYFTSPIPGVHIYDNVWDNPMEFFNGLLNKEFWEQRKGNDNYRPWVREDFLITKNIQKKMVSKQIHVGYIPTQISIAHLEVL